MTTINSAYQNALLADATYALNDDGLQNITGTPLATRLNTRMTPAVAKYISDNYTVVTHIESNDIVGSGFDATVWKDKTGKLTVSMQGTSGLQDFLSDADLAVTANARAQIVDMVNWWLKITTPLGQSARQIALEPIYNSGTPPVQLGTRFAAAPDIAGTGQVSAAALVAGIEVNGHSLGGYLATAFTRLFGSQAHVQHTSTFNSAGFAPGSEAVFTQLQNLIGISYGLGRYPTGAEQSNYFGVNGLNITTNSFYFSQQGKRVELYQEDGLGSFYGVPDPFTNHYMYKQTDLLALGAAFEKLDPSMTFGKLNELIKGGSNKMVASYEGLLDALRKALAGPNAETLLPNNASDTGNSDPSRNLYHDALTALQANPIFESLAGQLLVRPAGKDLAAAARNDFGALIALQDLSPLYISGTTPAAQNQLNDIWQIGRPTERAAWLADKSTTVPVTFTDQWIADRAALLQAIVSRNKQDNTNGLVYDAAAPGDRALALQFYETGTAQQQTLFFQRQGGAVAREQRIVFGNSDANTMAGTDNLLGDHLYGGAGDDNINGNAGADYLEGNAGNDTLNGGDNDKASDVLLGGQGTDTYQFNGNNGRDFIIDSDGQGSIQIDGATLTGGSQYGDNRVYRSADKKHLYVLANDKTLLINGQIVVQGYEKARGDFGLTYTDAALQTNPNTSLDIKGDFKPLDTNLAAAGIQTTLNDIGNIVTTTTAETGRADTLNDSAGNDHITSRGGSSVDAGADAWANENSHYLFRSCSRTYLLVRTPIRYPKTAQKASPDVQVSFRQMRCGWKSTINSIASGARKKSAKGQFVHCHSAAADANLLAEQKQ